MNWKTLLTADRERINSTEVKTNNDNRSPFKKDFDTVCNCTGLRRLQDKAQVFPLEKGDYARTRLTHSIEVMSIAESLGFSAIEVISKIDKPRADIQKILKDIPVILRTAALLHDMGNPPFGHLGEDIISEWFKENLRKIRFDKNNKVSYKEQGDRDRELYGIMTDEHRYDFEEFEGNAQLLRLVSKLSFVTDEHGMNLTFPVLATVIKYPCSSSEYISAKAKKQNNLLTKKPGYFCSEKELFCSINSTLCLDGKRHPLTFLLEAADDIAYLSSDLEDAQKKGIISLHDIEKYFSDHKYDSDLFVNDIRKSIEKYKKEGREQEYSDLDNYVTQRLRIHIKGYMISKVKDSFYKNYNLIMSGEYDKELLVDSDAKNVVKIIRQIEENHLYYCKEIIQSKIEAYRIISFLLQNFVLSVFNVENDGRIDNRDSLLYNLFSNNYKHICNLAISGKEVYGDDYIYSKLQLVTDLICGMTDSYALDIYKTLMASK